MSILATEDSGDDWDDVVGRYGPTLRRLIMRRTADPARVDDVLQETYLRALRTRHHPGRTEMSEGRWLSMLAKRASVDEYRGNLRRGTPVDSLSLVGEWATTDRAMAPGSDEHVDSLASREAVRWAFRRLTPRQQRLLVLRGVENLTYQEIAAREELTVEALTSALNRARHRLRAGIELYRSGEARKVPVALLLAQDGFRRLRDRFGRMQAMVSPHLVELAGATMALGIAAVASAPGTPSGALAVTPAVAIGSAESTVHVGATGSLPSASRGPAPAATTAAAVPVRVPPPAEATPGLLSIDPGLKLGPDETILRYVVDLSPYTGGQTSEASVEFRCGQSTVLKATCPVAIEVLPPQ